MKQRITRVSLAVAVAVTTLAWPLTMGTADVAHAVSACPTDLLSALTPANTNFNDPSAVNVGVVFHVDGAPSVHGVKFYKGSDNTGTHVAHLREVGGSSDLASATYTSETSSGWQTVNFGSDVPVQAGASYVVWVSMPNGHYAVDGGGASGDNGFYNHPFGKAGEDAAYITAGDSGLYEYTSSDTTAPTHTSSANYWVSPVVDDTTSPNDNGGLSVSDATAGPSVTWTTIGKDTNALTSTANPVFTSLLRDGVTVGRQSGGQPSWAYGPNDPTALPGTTHTYTVVNSDGCGNVSSGTSQSVTTASQTLSHTFGATPATLDSGQTDAVTVGMHWSTATSGNLWGARIYRAANTAPTGNAPLTVGLWDNDGTLLAARAVPLGNQQSGWIDVRFTSPVSVSANHDYVVGYFSPNGNEVFTNNVFDSAVTSGDLTARADSSTTANGVFVLGNTIAFPNNRSLNATWYGVDVDFYLP